MDSLTPKTPISYNSKSCILRSPIQTSPSIKQSPVTMQELLLLSSPPYQKSRSNQKPITVEDCIDSLEILAPNCSRRKWKSPRNGRRGRRRLDKENICTRDERESINFEECGDAYEKVRKRRQKKVKAATTDDCNKDNLALILVDSVSTSSNWEAPKTESEENHLIFNGLCELIFELIMWKDVAKSSLWFGLGAMFFISSSFSNDVSFSMISVISHLGLFVIGLSFFYDCLTQRQDVERKQTHYKLTEKDILRIGRIILPIGNIILAKSQIIFSGEPLMTLKVAPILLLASKYGHLLTFWRLLAIGFFLSFTLPKLYSFYGENLHKRAVKMIIYASEAWKSCPHKKIVATTITIILWNLFGSKMRIFTGFFALVVMRFNHQQNIRDAKSNSAAEEKKL